MKEKLKGLKIENEFNYRNKPWYVYVSHSDFMNLLPGSLSAQHELTPRPPL
jgi:hypothetical protein